jgi:CheY-like chemotaxis protein
VHRSKLHPQIGASLEKNEQLKLGLRDRPMRILAVDDDDIALEILSNGLHGAGHSDFVTAQSGAEALEIIAAAEKPFDIFLLDIQMPGIDGIELCAKVRRLPRYRTAPIIMITAMAERKFIDAAFAAGAMDYVNKPFDPVELGVRIGLAGRLVSQQKQFAASQSEVDFLKMQSGISLTSSASDALEIVDVPGFVSLTAMENYLLRLGRGMAFQSTSVAFAIKGFDLLHSVASPVEIYDILADTGEAIAAGLKRFEHLITYCGNGEFVAVCQKTSDSLDQDLLANIQNTLDAFEPSFADGRPCDVALVQSSSYSPSLWAAGDSLCLLVKPLESLSQQTRASTKRSKPKLFRPLANIM